MRSVTVAHLTLGGSPMENIDAAAHAGFGAVGLRICARRPGEPFAHALLDDVHAARAVRQRAADVGVRLSNISAYQFYPDVRIDQVEPVIAATAELGAPVVVANGFDPDEARFIDVLGRYCELAHRAGIRVALEFLPYSGVRTLPAALRILDAIDAPNAGVLPDALHLARSGGTPADLRCVPPSRVVFAQLCDASEWQGAQTDEALMTEARGARIAAGDGTLPLHDFLDALPEGCEIEYEVARGDLMDRSTPDKALAAAVDAERFLTLHRSRRAGTIESRP